MADTIIDYRGLLTFSSIDTLLTEFKLVSQERDIRFGVYKKILTVMIESLENVCKYTDAYDEFVSGHNEFLPTFELSMNSESIKLSTSNPIKNKDVDVLKAKIETVNEKDKEELKQLYIDTITNGKFSSKGGAGLGFIEMAKSSGNKLDFAFEKVDEDYSIYSFTVTFSI